MAKLRKREQNGHGGYEENGDSEEITLEIVPSSKPKTTLEPRKQVQGHRNASTASTSSPSIPRRKTQLLETFQFAENESRLGSILGGCINQLFQQHQLWNQNRFFSERVSPLSFSTPNP
ncbi:hypothetical protein I7I51_03995 [Histoplasma capsulatum]|uniref:Uncharacterized protein n=1 Tax=Ajellomyces capsulatus TaxID=5037 RepID=A0A8A1M5R3_AJECA|nr:hypothetical protein I7I51_03995 [Histoplasma capsulatum]